MHPQPELPTDFKQFCLTICGIFPAAAAAAAALESCPGQALPMAMATLMLMLMLSWCWCWLLMLGWCRCCCCLCCCCLCCCWWWEQWQRVMFMQCPICPIETTDDYGKVVTNNNNNSSNISNSNSNINNNNSSSNVTSRSLWFPELQRNSTCLFQKSQKPNNNKKHFCSLSFSLSFWPRCATVSMCVPVCVFEKQDQVC